MKSAPLSRRDRLRHIVADLRMPGALEALDAILHGDGLSFSFCISNGPYFRQTTRGPRISSSGSRLACADSDGPSQA